MTAKILYYNARSLIPKIDELRILCDTHRPNVVRIVESWLESISDTELAINNYQILSLNRNRHGGGEFMYVHNNIISKGPAGVEFLFLSIHINSFKLCRGLFCCPPISPPDVLNGKPGHLVFIILYS